LAEELVLEYGKATSEVHKDSINKNDSVLIIDDLIATGGTSIVAFQYSNTKSSENVSAGNLPFFLIRIRDFDKLYERADAKMKPRDSIATNLSNVIFEASLLNLLMVSLKASLFFIRVVISLNKIPFLG
jgi:hypothetical protein